MMRIAHNITHSILPIWFFSQGKGQSAEILKNRHDMIVILLLIWFDIFMGKGWGMSKDEDKKETNQKNKTFWLLRPDHYSKPTDFWLWLRFSSREEATSCRLKQAFNKSTRNVVQYGALSMYRLFFSCL